MFAKGKGIGRKSKWRCGMRNLLRMLVFLVVVSLVCVSNVWALASEDIVLTVTIQVLSVNVEDLAVTTNWGLGMVVGSTSCDSWDAGPVGYVAAPGVWQDGVTVTNDGNGDETFGLLVACTSGGTVWTNDTAGNDDNVADADEFVYRAIFDALAAPHTLAADDRVSGTMQKAEGIAGSRFTDGAATGASVIKDGTADLYVQFELPSSTAEGTPTEKTLTLTISAETTY